MDLQETNNEQKGTVKRLRLFRNWQSLRERMRHKRRVVVLDTDTFKERLSFELTGIRLVTMVGLVAIVVVVLTALIIAFTPLRVIIPGYVNPTMVEQTYHNARTIDSLQSVLDAQEQMIAKIQDIVAGKDMSTLDSITDTIDQTEITYTHSKADTELRREVERHSSRNRK